MVSIVQQVEIAATLVTDTAYINSPLIEHSVSLDKHKNTLVGVFSIKKILIQSSKS